MFFKNRSNSIIIFASIIIISSIVIYLPTLKSGFIWDDIQLITNPLKIKQNPYILFWGSGIYYRPFLHLSMLIDYSFWHLNPIGYHFTNIFLHILNSVLVFIISYFIVKRHNLSSNVKNETQKNFQQIVLISFFSAMLFALHPINTESVAWISGRTDILSTIFFLLAFLSLLLYEKEKKNIALFLISVFFLFSLFSKENAIAFILLTVSYGILVKLPRRQMFSSLSVLFLTFIAYLFLRHGGVSEISKIPGTKEGFFTTSLSLLDFLKVLSLGTGYYVEKLLLPFNLNLLPKIPENPIYFIFFSLPFILIIALYLKNKRIQLFLLLWIFICLLPSLPILFSKMANPIAQRYLYLPSVGFCILLALTFSNVKNKKVFLLPFIILIVIYSTSTYERLKVWKNDTTLWENTVQKNPESILARINYGSSLSRIGEYKKAKKELLTALTKQGIKLSDVSTVLFLLGEAERENKNYRNAEEYFINSIKAEPKNVAAYNALGYLYLQLSSSSEFSDKKKHEFLERAIESYEYVIKLSPTFYHAIYHLGLCYIKKNDLEKAEKYFKSVIELDPERELSANAFNYLLIIEVMKIKKR